MRLSVRVPLLFLALSIVPLAAMSIIAFFATRQALELRVEDQLMGISTLKQSLFELWVQDGTQTLRQLAQRPLVRQLSYDIITLPSDDPAHRSAYDSLLAQHLAPVMVEGRVFLSISLVRASDGVIIVSTEKPMEGTSRADEEFFQAGKTTTFVDRERYIASESQVAMHVSTPVTGPDNTLVAVLTAHLDMGRVERNMLTPSAGIATEDTYLVDVNRFFVTEPRFAAGMAHTAVVRNAGVDRCIQGQSGAGEWLDYRRVLVVGAYRWIANSQLCIVTEIDRAEAYAPVYALRSRMLQVSVLAGLLVAGLGLFASRRLTLPLGRLVAGVEAIGNGMLEHRIPASGRDELGQLARAFNEMADRRGLAEAALEAHHRNLEALVQERTSEVVSANHALQIEVRERAHTEERLRQTLADLERSNRDLEQFAYVASHDLQEPLRMVSSFTQLLAQRYRGRLDSDADEFIRYAVDGAKRMQQQILDLLSFSRVGTRGEPFRPAEVAWSLEQALKNLRTAIEESGAVITSGPLPTVTCDRGQLVQLFQNLLSNAIKFRGLQPPMVRVESHRDGNAWVFSVKDNGIGIDPRFSERVFTLFQRLHARDAYPGTGIGLAITRRIVERHGGRIWVESTPGEGSTFLFTIPDRRDPDEQEPVPTPDEPSVGGG